MQEFPFSDNLVQHLVVWTPMNVAAPPSPLAVCFCRVTVLLFRCWGWFLCLVLLTVFSISSQNQRFLYDCTQNKQKNQKDKLSEMKNESVCG